MGTVNVKRYDTYQTLTDVLTYGGSAIDLTGATVVLVIKPKSGAAVRRDATITDAASGAVSYRLVAGDTATAGEYDIEWEITFSDDSIMTVPTSGYHAMVVNEDLG